MFEAQIRKYASLACTRADSHRHCNSRNNLHPGAKIECPPHTRTQQYGVRPRRLVWTLDGLVANEEAFEQHIELRMRQPYDAGSAAVTRSGCAISGRIAGIGDDRR